MSAPFELADHWAGPIRARDRKKQQDLTAIDRRDNVEIAEHISQRATKLLPDDISEHTETWPDLASFWPDDDDLIDWYLKTNANLVQYLEAASPADDLLDPWHRNVRRRWPFTTDYS